jgi:DNA-binding beta-propeller fold protein YncE
VADKGNHRIRKITPQGHVSILAGTGEEGYRDGEGTVAQFMYPGALAVDGGGNIIVADQGNHRVRRITPQGQVSTLAGTGEQGYIDGEGTVAQLFYYPTGIAVDRGGNVIVAEGWQHYRIRKITPQGHVSTLAEISEEGDDDIDDGDAHFEDPSGVAVDGDGNVIVAEAENNRIGKITPQGHVSTLAGSEEYDHADGNRLASAYFSGPRGVAVDENGHIIVADTGNHCISRVISDGVTPLLMASSLPPLLQSSFAFDIQHHLFDTGYFHDVCFVVEEERVPAHRTILSARCEYFRSMFSDGFKEGDGGDVHINNDTSSVAFKALLKYLYRDSTEVDDEAVLLDLAKLCDQYQVERLHNHCVHQLFNGITARNAVMRLVQAHTASGESPMWAELKSKTMSYVARNFEEIWCNERPSLEILDREHPEFFKQMLLINCGLKVE